MAEDVSREQRKLGAGLRTVVVVCLIGTIAAAGWIAWDALQVRYRSYRPLDAPAGELQSSEGPILDGDRPASLNEPAFVAADAAEIDDDAIVLGVAIDGDVRAYALSLLSYYEIVNDEVAGHPIAVTRCPPAGSAVVYSRRIQRAECEFKVFPALMNGSMMIEAGGPGRRWSQVTGSALTERRTTEGDSDEVMDGRDTRETSAVPGLQQIPFARMRWADWRRLHPSTRLLAVDGKTYDPDRFDDRTLTASPPDVPIGPNEIVVALRIGKVAKAYRRGAFIATPVIEDTVAAEPVVVFRSPSSEFSVVYSRRVGDTVLSFEFDTATGALRDTTTRSKWNVYTGKAVSGKRTGQRLRRIPHREARWNVWSAFNPEGHIWPR